MRFVLLHDGKNTRKIKWNPAKMREVCVLETNAHVSDKTYGTASGTTKCDDISVPARR